MWVLQVLINGKVSGFFERSNPRNLPLPNIFSDIDPNEEVGQRSPGPVSHRFGVQRVHGLINVVFGWCKIALHITG